MKDIQLWLGHGEHKNAQLKNNMDFGGCFDKISLCFDLKSMSYEAIYNLQDDTYIEKAHLVSYIYFYISVSDSTSSHTLV